MTSIYNNLLNDEKINIVWQFKEKDKNGKYKWNDFLKDFSDNFERAYNLNLDTIEINNQKYKIDLLNMVLYDNKFNHKKYIRRLEQITKITCLGCLEDQPNQLAHIGLGGCLYDPEVEDFE